MSPRQLPYPGKLRVLTEWEQPIEELRVWMLGFNPLEIMDALTPREVAEIRQYCARVLAETEAKA